MKFVNYNPYFPHRWAQKFLINDSPAISPSVNISEKENGFYLELAAPGFAKEDFKIEIQKDQLVISGEKKGEINDESKPKWIRQEFNHSAFKRSFYLSPNIFSEAIEASYEQGILKLFIPKKAEIIPTIKSIEIA